MSDYKEMYFTLFNAMSEAIFILQQAQKSTEEICIEQGGAELILLKPKEGEAD